MKVISIICFALALGSCKPSISTKETKSIQEVIPEMKHKFTNKLINETSPYLLQHAHNPVNWYPWGDEALEKAKIENKLIIISVGYAACHWCHVMEHESFENEEVAKFMNENFVAIKVDREERPDVDQVYMNAVQILIGRGGWPLNCIALPDGKPLYGGTYFPKDDWMSVLTQIKDYVDKNPEKARLQAESLVEGIKSSELVELNKKKVNFSSNDLNTIFANWKGLIDYELGGYKRAPKFPLPIGYQYLLQYSELTNNKEALKAVTLTLDEMIKGGIYDQIGGGFARYSTDKYWKAPHFEKMLYDNSQLVTLYSQAYQKTKNKNYKQCIVQSLEFIKRELTSEEGGFYSSLDADSEGEEGKFYVWKYEEIEKILGTETDFFTEYYNIEKRGNWEKGNNILLRKKEDAFFSKKYKLSEVQLRQIVDNVNEKLLLERAKRIRPGLDDKILTSWNALMLKGYVDAYRVFDKDEYLEVALKNASFIQSKLMKDDNSLFRNYKNGKASINGFLDDYAFSIQAFISLYQATFDEKWLNLAKNLTEYTLVHFYDNETGMFYYTSDMDPALVARKMEVADNVIPASNSEMAKNLYILGHYFYEKDYLKKSKQMLNNVIVSTKTGGPYYANWDILMAWVVSEPYEISIIGENHQKVRKEFDKNYLPNVFYLGGEKEGSLQLLESKLMEGQTTIYVCKDKSCDMPTTKVAVALSQMKK
jgi:uncharacterized protein YyaL (SSP411 family)